MTGLSSQLSKAKLGLSPNRSIYAALGVRFKSGKSKNKRRISKDILLLLVLVTGLSSQLSKAPQGLSPNRSILCCSWSSFQVRYHKKNKAYPQGYALFFVLVTGLEPVRYCYRGILSPLRLPISPHQHINKYIN